MIGHAKSETNRPRPPRALSPHRRALSPPLRLSIAKHSHLRVPLLHPQRLPAEHIQIVHAIPAQGVFAKCDYRFAGCYCYKV